MRRLIGISMVFLMGGLLAGEAAACSCVEVKSPQEALERSHAAFYGKIVSVREAEEYYEATFAVVRSWKGVLSPEVKVRSGKHSCGIGLNEGATMLVFAYRHEGVLETGLCTGTRYGEAAAADAHALGEPQFIFDENFPFDDFGDSGGGLCGGPDNLAALQGLSLIFLGLLWRRRRRTPPAAGK